VKKSFLFITLSDDGVGFRVDVKRKMSTGLGLGNIYHRVHLLNGKIRIISTPETGTEIKIKLRIPAHAHE
jgi:signal transduction histidine kinase